ncbi:MAG: divergent polysaccharide deacetylase family protein, partial [Cucumibacter sp.]
MANELDAPLGRRSARAASRVASKRARRIPLAVVAILVAVAALLIPTVWVLVVNGPEGGRPAAEIDMAPAPSGGSGSQLTLDVAEEIARNAETASPDLVGSEVPSEAAITEIDGLPVGRDIFGPLPDLIEASPHGPVPRLGPGGQKPADIYARASIGPAAAAGRPRIALLVTGLGLAEASSRSAISGLPGNVTLAFAPYGDLVVELAHAAREGGHEIMLQIPMEPFDYPDTDPGPQTLLAGEPASANLDRLYWLMSRIGAYTGLVNYMGAR